MLVACSQERNEPPPASHPVTTRTSIDVTVHGAPVSIRGLELVPSGKSLELGYRVEASNNALSVPGEIMCRVHGYNLVYPATTSGKVAGPRLTGLFKPDPFSEAPTLCEISFRLDQRRIGAACFHDGELTDGACPEGSFPPPPPDQGALSALVGRVGVTLEHAALELREDAAVVTAIYTLVTPLPAGHRLAAHISCDDAAGPIVGEAGFAFVPLDRLPAGSSVYGPVAILLDRKPAQLAACDLRFLSRATDARSGSSEQEHAHYCVTTAAIRVGRCTAN